MKIRIREYQSWTDDEIDSPMYSCVKTTICMLVINFQLASMGLIFINLPRHRQITVVMQPISRLPPPPPPTPHPSLRKVRMSISVLLLIIILLAIIHALKKGAWSLHGTFVDHWKFTDKNPDYFNVVSSVNLAFNLQISKSKSDSQSETGFHCGLYGQLSWSR